jgi:hypothetical protein
MHGLFALCEQTFAYIIHTQLFIFRRFGGIYYTWIKISNHAEPTTSRPKSPAALAFSQCKKISLKIVLLA